MPTRFVVLHSQVSAPSIFFRQTFLIKLYKDVDQVPIKKPGQEELDTVFDVLRNTVWVVERVVDALKTSTCGLWTEQ
jgi:hypothetical protein